MKDNRNTPFLPDLSRYIKTQTSGTLYLNTLCHYRFNEYANTTFPSFDDLSNGATKMVLYTVTGSLNSNGAYSPTLTTLETPNLAFENSPFNNTRSSAWPGQPDQRTIDGQAQTVRFATPVGDGQRAIRPFSRQFINFDNLLNQRVFLAGERYRASHMDASNLAEGQEGYTYMVRFRYNGTAITGNNIFCIGSPNKASISLSTIASSTQLQVKYTKYDNANAVYATKTKTITTGLTNTAAAGGTSWLVLFFSILPKGIANIRVYDMNTGETVVGLPVNSISNGWQNYTSPNALSASLYFGYGDPAPATSFLPTDFSAGIELQEFVTFKSVLETSVQQAIVRSSRSYPKSNREQAQSLRFTGNINRGILYGTNDGPFKSGFNNIPVRRTLQAHDTRATLPTIKRSGNQDAINSGSITPFDDRRTMVYGTTQKMVFPEMLPAALFSGSGEGNWGSDDSRAWSDVHKTVFSHRLTASANLKSGIEDVTTLTMNRGLGHHIPNTLPGVFQPTKPQRGKIIQITNTTRDRCFGSILAPFNDSARPTDTHYISASGTPDTVLPGFDSKIGDKIAIVIDLGVDRTAFCGTARGINAMGTGSIVDGDAKGKAARNRHYPIMYYNAAGRTWERPRHDVNWTSPDFSPSSGNSNSTPGTGYLPAAAQALSAVPCGFLGTTGFTIYPSASDPCANLASRGRFTDFFGFPYADKYAPNSDDSKIKMSKYINEPFVLEHVLFEVEGKVYEAGPDGLGLRMGGVRDLPFTGSTNAHKGGFPAVPTGAAATISDASQDANRIYGRGGVIGGGDLVNAAPTFNRLNVYVDPVTAAEKYKTVSYATDAGVRMYTGNQVFIPGPGITVVTEGVNNAARDVSGTVWNTFNINSWTEQGEMNVIDPGNNYPVLLHTHANKYRSVMTKVTGSAAPFWRCDTFFLLRCKKGSASGNSWANPITQTGHYATSAQRANAKFRTQPANGFGMSMPGTTGQNNGVYVPWLSASIGWAQKFTDEGAGTATVNCALTGANETRELITYNQMVHYGYVSSSFRAQMISDGSGLGVDTSGTDNPKYNNDGSLNRPMLVSSPDTIVKTAVSNDMHGGNPVSHWDFVLYGTFESGSMLGRYPNPDLKVKQGNNAATVKSALHYGTQGGLASTNWLDRGLGRDLNLNIGHTSREHDLGLVTGSLIETTGSVIRYPRAGQSGGGDSITTFIRGSKAGSDRPLSEGIYRIFGPCRQPVIDPGAGSVGIQYTTTVNNNNTSFPYFMSVQEIRSENTRFNNPDLTSGRSMSAAAPGVEILEEASKFTVLPAQAGLHSGFTVQGFNPQGGQQWAWNNNVYPPSILGQVNVKPAKSYSATSPYVLLPEDEIIIGFQCAMAGGNDGNPVAINTNPGHFAPSGDMTVANPPVEVTRTDAANTLYGHDFARRNQARLDYFDHRFEFLPSSRSKVILYGSLVRNNKEKPPVSNQPLTSNSVREALSDGSVLDQFDVNSRQEYTGSYTAELIAGPTNLQYRVVKQSGPSVDSRGRVASGSNMGISGSFQRFVTLVDQSEVYYDSLIPNMVDIFAADGKNVPRLEKALRNPSSLPWSNAAPRPMGVEAPLSFWAWPDWDPDATGDGPTNMINSSNLFWQDSFPFEQKYAGIERMTDDGTAFGTTGSFSSWGYGRINTGSIPGSCGPIRPTPVGGGNSPTYQDELNIVASVATVGGGNTDPNVQMFLPPAKAFRAAALGYGRQNRKWLDLLQQQPGLYLSADYQQNYYHMDHPVGVKYGMANFVKQRTRASFRSDHYGQLRDMLEQRRYTRFFEEGDDYNPRGLTDSVVNCIFVDADGAPITDTTTTTCFNLSTEATSSKPYFEGETPTRTIIFTSRFVAVDFSAADTTRFRFP